MKKLLYISLLITSFIHAQNKSLFWEISGNGLAKNSYLYGTMHVNEKVSFHLSDSFFKNLLGSDIVANESNPETWGELNDLMKNNDYKNYPKFYTEFYLFPTTKENIKTIFNNDNAKYFRNMLSGAEGDQADFQENTVLDMFIFQTGKKYKKKIAGLENAKESMLSILNIMDDDAKPKDENKVPLMKILKNRNPTEVLKEYYREKDIVMLDSIYKLMFSKKAHDALIVNRNKIMAKSIDSIAKTGSLFSAVGAAHLGGNEGIIELLRQKGYTVKPIIDTFTENGKNQKKTIESYFPNPNFNVTSTKDKMLQLPLYKTTIEENESLGSPDFTNGGAITIKRMPLNFFLKTKDITYNAKSLDSLFFEKIAGDIIEKKYFEQANYSGYDIKNITKTGNSQHSKFYITPLEIISIAMTGPANYVRQYENEVFENIKIKPFKNDWEKVKPIKGGFEVEIPSFNLVFGNSAEKGTNIDIQAYDNQEKSYYFLREKTLNDTQTLENSEYEQKQIHYQFYLQQDQDSTATQYNKTENSFISSSKIGDRNMKLKTIIAGNKYYLLGTVNASEANTNRYFKSFLTIPLNYRSKSRTFTDSIANYKIDIPEKGNENLFLNLKSKEYQSKNAFIANSKYQPFNSETARKISLEYYKYPKYERNLPIDSIETKLKKEFLKQVSEDFTANRYEEEDFDMGSSTSLYNAQLYSKKGFSESLWYEIMSDKKNSYEFLNENTTFNKENNSYTIDATVSKPNATQAVKYKVLYKNNAYYVLSTLVEKNYKNEDAFIEKAFNSLALASNKNTDISEDKIKLFIEDATSKSDTIRYSALKSINNLDFTANDFEIVTNFINTFNFKENETVAISSLLEKIGEMKDERVIPFLENYYKKEFIKTEVQISILKALSNQKSKTAYKKINELLDYDLPISDNQYEITMLFFAFEKDAENSKELFPEIFQYYSIKEFHKPILNFCNSLLEQKLISAKKLKVFKKIILTNAKLEYKRVLSWNQKNKANEEIENDEETMATYMDSGESVSDLINYTTLLYNFDDDNAVKEVLRKIKNLDILELNIELARLGITHNQLTSSEINEFLNDPQTQFATINLLLNQNKKEFITFNDDEIAKAAAINFQFLTKKDSITLLKKKIVQKNGHDISLYFYKIKKKTKEISDSKNQLYTIGFITENGKINPLAFNVIDIKMINEDEDLEKKYNLIVSEFLNGEHLRASFEKEKADDEIVIDEEY
ncbi:TraB/GumN family protein [Flavobacterium sp. JLP]|uniref:TraB/GumN family protein n=1 Tax=Flavobacterium sp. JLP TaxID=2783793 RepID=UPI00188D880C|nr:TraB/GumN family protein [Flavobacterium sp. JLP]MBF4506836.1 TraB/GumN family protein [Flavobacterium sp. JLP]